MLIFDELLMKILDRVSLALKLKISFVHNPMTRKSSGGTFKNLFKLFFLKVHEFVRYYFEQ